MGFHFQPGILPSRFRISSARPSAKNSCSLSTLTLAMGGTAIDGYSFPVTRAYSSAARNSAPIGNARLATCAGSE